MYISQRYEGQHRATPYFLIFKLILALMTLKG